MHLHLPPQLGADIIIPLDELPPYHTEQAVLEASLQRSHRWMARRWGAALSRAMPCAGRGAAAAGEGHGGAGTAAAVGTRAAAG